MARRGGDWVPCEDYGGDLSISSGLAANIPLVTTVDTVLPGPPVQPLREVGTVETGSEVIVNRVVGQVRLRARDSDVFYIERIRVGIRDNAGAFAFFANSFEDAADANEAFLWQRVGFLEAGATNLIAAFGHPWWSMIDCRVSRRLRDGMALYYSVENLSVLQSELLISAYLRSWARVV